MSPPPAVPRLYPPYVRRLIRSSAILWILLRLVLLATTRTVVLSAPAGAVVVAVTGFLVWLDGRRFREHVFLSNLATAPAWGVGLALAVAAALELLARALIPLLLNGNAAAFLG